MKACAYPLNPQTTEEQMLRDLMKLISSSHKTWSHPLDQPDIFTLSINTIGLNLHESTIKYLRQVLTRGGTVPPPKFFSGMPQNTIVEKAAEYFYETSLHLQKVDKNLK